MGWVDSSVFAGERPIHKYLPELEFVDGAIGYLRFSPIGTTPEELIPILQKSRSGSLIYSLRKLKAILLLQR